MSLRFRGMLNDKLRGFYRSHLHRRRRRRAGHRHHPVRGHRRPPGLPVLGRARLQGRLRHHPRRRRRPRSRCPTPPRSRDERARRRQATRALRRHDDDVHLPRGLHRRARSRSPSPSTSPARRCASALPAGQGPPHRVRARGGRVLACAYLADYFDIPYPGDKIDLVAVPDFAFGAMENLGCVTFRETLLLVDPRPGHPGRAAERRRRDRPRAGPHVVRRPRHDEVVERHLAQRGLRHLHGAARSPTPSGPSGSGGSASAWPAPRAFDTDALGTHPSHRVPGGLARGRRGHVRRPHLREGRRRRADARAVPRARSAFRDGHPQVHGRATSYGNTETTDLWDAIEEATGEPVRRIMDSWIFQGGFPIVSVDARRRRHASCTCTQERFRLPARRARRPTPAGPSPCSRPLRASTVGRGRHRRRSCSTATSSSSTSPEPVAWVVANTEGHGFYRVALRRPRCARPSSPRPRRACPTSSATASSTTPGRPCSPARRDGRGLPRAGRRASRAETDVSVWRRLINGLEQIERLVDGPARAALHARVRGAGRARARAARLGRPRPDDGDRDRELRGVLIEALADARRRRGRPGAGGRRSSSATAPTAPASRRTWPRRS